MTPEHAPDVGRAAEAGRPVVLVVDDNVDTQDILRLSLTYAGYGVAQAWDGGEAVCIIRSAPPALVLMDLVMPGVSGLEASRTLRDDPATARIPIVALSAQPVREGLTPDEHRLFTAYLMKPVEPRRVVEAIRRLVGPGAPGRG